MMIEMEKGNKIYQEDSRTLADQTTTQGQAVSQWIDQDQIS